ncbi:MULTISPECIES: RT0821/Lpp0805 family surface protein [Bradyrhizobium]|uniref:RT0821/Lpp0805 family surface protein n=1 Tax=Bradyrhizobium TaxID=374 RepID=UPI00040C48BC|nr:RT0821/Lpp0805 family surface protein [Bradyrhizobium sp. SEMIA]UFW51939.1 hypothetical protein BaraCB756_13555 [Bradyrhizobium arachidis]
MTIILIGLGAGGCSFSRNDKTAYAKADDSDLTGSIARKDAPPTETDLAFARNAASDVLSKGDKDSSQHWENPETGARGSVTPIAQSYAAEDGRKCRDFLASYVNGSTESWLQGAGCQSSHGRWEIHTLKPWRS